MEFQDCMITTKDNPYDPFLQFDQWYNFDTQMGYNTLSLLARVAYTSDEMSEADQQLSILSAIDEICLNDPTENYIQVYKY